MKYISIQKENSDLRDLVQILIEKSSKLEEKMTGITTKGNNEQSTESSSSTINDQRTLMPDVSKLIDNVYELANQFFELLRIGETDNNIGTG